VSANTEETKAQEILIIRRSRDGGEEGHHGGVWKIAYADFMTAMMAFFLVMWLINSTDQKTLTQVATYFNPLRLTDKTPTSRGVQQESDAQSRDSPAKESPAKDAPAKGGKQKDSATTGDAKSDAKSEAGRGKYTEDALFRDPYGVLDKLAAEAARDQSRATPRTRGEAFRDPFDPAFRRETRTEGPESAGASPPSATSSRPVKGAPADKPSEVQGADQSAGQSLLEAAKAAQARREAEAVATGNTAARLGAEIKQIVAQAARGTIPNIDVTATSEGVLISLTDDFEFGMFAIASAEPRPAMVVVMDKLAKVLAGHPERLVVRGHTDGRPYKSGTYDNWRLSTARAHMAYYMLVRGGIDEKRFERVEGYADRSLRVPADPEAAQNRRIEILLRKAQS